MKLLANKFYSLAFFILIISGCLSNKKNTATIPWNYQTEHFLAKGELKYSTFTFCGPVPKEVEYHYKFGDWTFWDFQGHKKAEGRFDNILEEMDIGGGCPVHIRYSNIKVEHWTFWNEDGVVISPTDSLVGLLERESITLSRLKSSASWLSNK